MHQCIRVLVIENDRWLRPYHTVDQVAGLEAQVEELSAASCEKMDTQMPTGKLIADGVGRGRSFCTGNDARGESNELVAQIHRSIPVCR
jgi:hypothetical protein